MAEGVERLILEKLSEMNQGITVIGEQVHALGEQVNVLSEKVSALDTRLTRVEEKVYILDTGFAGLTKRVEDLDQGLTSAVKRVRLILENDISRKIDVIGEGHDFLKARLEDSMKMEIKREAMELELINLRLKVLRMEDYLNIA